MKSRPEIAEELSDKDYKDYHWDKWIFVNFGIRQGFFEKNREGE